MCVTQENTLQAGMNGAQAGTLGTEGCLQGTVVVLSPP